MRWNYKEIDYHGINREKVKDNDFLYTLLCMASFVEITSDIYEKNLVDFYKDDEEITKWVREIWEPEEIQHGKSLREYIVNTWPDCKWDEAYKKFRNEYEKVCTIDEFQPTRAREMLARMIVETGTSTLYASIRDYAKELNEPVLEQICANISKDEVYHYEQFEKGFSKYNEIEKLSRTDIVKIIYNRLKEINDEDSYIAYKNIKSEENYEEFKKSINKFAKKYYHYNMAVKMLMQPLKLNRYVEATTQATIKAALKILGI